MNIQGQKTLCSGQSAAKSFTSKVPKVVPQKAAGWGIWVACDIRVLLPESFKMSPKTITVIVMISIISTIMIIKNHYCHCHDQHHHDHHHDLRIIAKMAAVPPPRLCPTHTKANLSVPWLLHWSNRSSSSSVLSPSPSPSSYPLLSPIESPLQQVLLNQFTVDVLSSLHHTLQMRFFLYFMEYICCIIPCNQDSLLFDHLLQLLVWLSATLAPLSPS